MMIDKALLWAMIMKVFSVFGVGLLITAGAMCFCEKPKNAFRVLVIGFFGTLVACVLYLLWVFS